MAGGCIAGLGGGEQHEANVVHEGFKGVDAVVHLEEEIVRARVKSLFGVKNTAGRPIRSNQSMPMLVRVIWVVSDTELRSLPTLYVFKAACERRMLRLEKYASARGSMT